MGQYGQYLRELLAPLGVYELAAGSVSGSELDALGERLDAVSERLKAVERETLTATAEDEGLERREALFRRRPAAVTAAQRRAAIAALLQIDGDSLTPEMIDRTISGCGIKARALEIGNGQLRVIFPEVAGEPAEFQKIRKIILDILPAHLEVEFYLRFLTWAECEERGYTWAAVEAEGHTFHSFERNVLL